MVKNLENVPGKFLMYPRPKRKDTEIPQSSGPTDNVADEVVYGEMDDSSGPRRQETIGDTIAQTRSENVSKHSNDPLLARGNALQSGENRLKLQELMELCTTLQARVLALETTNTTQAMEITKGLGEEGASKQGRIADIDANEDIYLVNVQTDEDMFCVNDLDGDEVIVEISVATTTTTTTAITDVEMTLAQALAELKSAKPKADKVVIQKPEQDKGKGKMVEPKPVNKMSKKELLRLDKELAFKLQAEEEEEEERLAREKAQQLAQRLQAQEQDELIDDEKARLFVQFLEQRRKHFVSKRAEEKRNRPPTRAQQRSIMYDGDDVTIDATPLSTKSLTIVEYKMYKEGKKSYFQIIIADDWSRNSLRKAMYLNEVFGSILLVIMKLLMKKLDDFGDKYQVYGRIVRIKSLLEVTAAKVCVTAAKVPMLKPGEFELWRMRIEQYIQMIDYALWGVIENGNTIPKTTVIKGVEKVIPPITAEEKA
ncbi:hypothetical protein Tco_0816819 [Tanacetum coccineum]